MPTMAKNKVHFLCFIISINQNEKASAKNVHPPLAKIKDDVHIRLIIGVTNPSEYPAMTPINPAIKSVLSFCLFVLRNFSEYFAKIYLRSA